MNSEFEPISGNLPPQEPGKVNELIYPVAGEEVDGDKWTPNQQPPVDTSLPETNVSPQLEQDIADATNEIAKGLVNDDLNIRPPLKTEMPDKVVSESPLNEPNGTESIGEFGQIEQRAFDELKNKAKEPTEPGWVGTAFVNPEAVKPRTEAAPPPPPPPPSGPPSGPPPPYDKNEIPSDAYKKTTTPAEFNPEALEGAEDNIIKNVGKTGDGVAEKNIQQQDLIDFLSGEQTDNTKNKY